MSSLKPQINIAHSNAPGILWSPPKQAHLHLQIDQLFNLLGLLKFFMTIKQGEKSNFSAIYPRPKAWFQSLHLK